VSLSTSARLGCLALLSVTIAACSTPQAPSSYSMTTPIPPEITTPSSVDTRIGKLEFFDGVPTPDNGTEGL
jgi:hypothetical protein